MPAAKEKTYKCLNPAGIQDAVDVSALAPRLNSIEGKTIHLSICGEPDITIPLEKRLKGDFPDVNWTVKKTYNINPIQLTEEERKTTDGVILGVCW
ncbi:MAG TPA: hypothetical protein VJK47_00420 [Dehalococcoidales bacterium]|nr:hypothetical protein [Dehalococcoidales bacterium]